MKKLVRAGEGRLVVFPRATAVGAGRSIMRLAPDDPPVELEVDRFIRLRLACGDLVAVDPAAPASVPAPAPAPAVAPSPKHRLPAKES